MKFPKKILFILLFVNNLFAQSDVKTIFRIGENAKIWFQDDDSTTQKKMIYNEQKKVVMKILSNSKVLDYEKNIEKKIVVINYTYLYDYEKTNTIKDSSDKYENYEKFILSKNLGLNLENDYYNKKEIGLEKFIQNNAFLFDENGDLVTPEIFFSEVKKCIGKDYDNYVLHNGKKDMTKEEEIIFMMNLNSSGLIKRCSIPVELKKYHKNGRITTELIMMKLGYYWIAWRDIFSQKIRSKYLKSKPNIISDSNCVYDLK